MTAALLKTSSLPHGTGALPSLHHRHRRWRRKTAGTHNAGKDVLSLTHEVQGPPVQPNGATVLSVPLTNCAASLAR